MFLCSPIYPEKPHKNALVSLYLVEGGEMKRWRRKEKR
jgi:hypothetical protein